MSNRTKGRRVKYSGQKSQLEDQVRALEILEGYPLRPTHIGKFCQALADKDPTFGLTTKMADVEEVDGDFSVELDEDVVEKHRGKTVRIGNRDVVVGPEVRPNSATGTTNVAGSTTSS